MTIDRNRLEAQLRDLGRSLAETPSRELVEQTKELTCEALVRRADPNTVRATRHWVLAVLAILVVSLPIPAMFLWFDWNAVSALLRPFCSARVTSLCAGAYIWLKVSILGLVYLMLVPLLTAIALKIHVRDGGQMMPLGAEG
jgi:hypothetical protein